MGISCMRLSQTKSGSQPRMMETKYVSWTDMTDSNSQKDSESGTNFPYHVLDLESTFRTFLVCVYIYIYIYVYIYIYI